jgi:RNA polymerase sigma factor (sigma-70 family)
MTQRRRPELEQLEARETPDVSLGFAAAPPALPPLASTALNNVSADTAPVLTGVEPRTLIAALAEALHALPKDSPSARTLETFFATWGDLGPLLTGLPDAVDADGQPADSSARTNGNHVTADAVPSGWEFLRNYVRKAIRNEERRHGRLPDHEDLVQQVFVQWWEQVGPHERAFARVLQVESPERFALRKTVRRVLDHVRYEHNRDRRQVALFDRPAPVNPDEQDWQDLCLDWTLDGASPDARARQLLELRRQGLTFQEIGDELGLLKQRVSELYNAAIELLQERYGPQGAVS